MDDFILVHPDKNYLKFCRVELEKMLANIGLRLNKKTGIFPIKNGIKMLQWRFIIADSGAIIRKMNKKKQGKERRKLRKIFDKEIAGICDRGTAKVSLIAWLANAKRGNTYYEQQKMIEYYKTLEGKYYAK